MTQLLVFKEHFLKFYQKNMTFFNLLFRFLISFISFHIINKMVGYKPELNHISTELIVSLVTMLVPVKAFVFVLMLFLLMHIYYVSYILAFVVAVLFFVVYCGYTKFVPEHGYAIVAFSITLPIHMAYGIPIYLGLVYTPMSFIAIVIGVGMYYFLQTMVMVLSSSTVTGIDLYQLVITEFTRNKQMHVVIAVFSIVTIIVYLIRKRNREYAFEISIFTGTVSNIVLLLIGNYVFQIHLNILYMIMGSLVSMILVFAYQFMHLSLDYSGVENIQFEDEEYYYYVKAVPKISISAPEKTIKNFSEVDEKENVDEIENREGEEKDYE